MRGQVPKTFVAVDGLRSSEELDVVAPVLGRPQARGLPATEGRAGDRPGGGLVHLENTRAGLFEKVADYVARGREHSGSETLPNAVA